MAASPAGTGQATGRALPDGLFRHVWQEGGVVAFISGFQRLADPSRELLAYYRLAAETRMQHRLIARRLVPGTA